MEDQCVFASSLGIQCPNKAAPKSNYCDEHGLLQQRSRKTIGTKVNFGGSTRGDKADWSHRTASVGDRKTNKMI
jgi:hypothetical protein